MSPMPNPASMHYRGRCSFTHRPTTQPRLYWSTHLCHCSHFIYQCRLCFWCPPCLAAKLTTRKGSRLWAKSRVHVTNPTLFRYFPNFNHGRRQLRRSSLDAIRAQHSRAWPYSVYNDGSHSHVYLLYTSAPEMRPFAQKIISLSGKTKIHGKREFMLYKLIEFVFNAE